MKLVTILQKLHGCNGTTIGTWRSFQFDMIDIEIGREFCLFFSEGRMGGETHCFETFLCLTKSCCSIAEPVMNDECHLTFPFTGVKEKKTDKYVCCWNFHFVGALPPLIGEIDKLLTPN